MLTYTSLFDKVSSDDLKRFYAYRGTVSQLIEDLRTDLPTPTLIYHPTRLIKAFIDYKILHPEKETLPNIIRYLIELTKEIYNIHTTQFFKLTSLKLMLNQHSLEDILNFEVVQEDDTAACLSSIGNLTQKTAQKIFKETNGSSILLIPIAHGATPAGIDLLLRYSILTQNSFSTVYPCRFSAHKLHDTIPQLHPKEVEFLKKEARGKSIVVFEENVVTGTSLKKVSEYFKTHLFPDVEIFSETNLDISEGVSSSASGNTHEELLKKFLLQYEEESNG